MDISGAFDIVNPTCLLDILRKKGLLFWVVQWIQVFISDQNTTIVIQGYETLMSKVEIGVPQGSPLSLILFLLYTASLYEIYNCLKEGLGGIGFSDDVNLLAYSQSTEANCRNLERVHQELLRWAHKHGMQFAPQKYKLIHFSRKTKKFNMQASIQIGEIEKTPS